jgi:hypothetical protein
MIRRMLGADQRLGQAWGADQPDMVIAEEQEELGDIRISLRRDSTGAISLVVRVEPPFAGVALISVAGDRLQAPLDDAGCAHFCGLPEALLVADGAADLTVMIDATC